MISFLLSVATDFVLHGASRKRRRVWHFKNFRGRTFWAYPVVHQRRTERGTNEQKRADVSLAFPLPLRSLAVTSCPHPSTNSSCKVPHPHMPALRYPNLHFPARPTLSCSFPNPTFPLRPLPPPFPSFTKGIKLRPYPIVSPRQSFLCSPSFCA